MTNQTPERTDPKITAVQVWYPVCELCGPWFGPKRYATEQEAIDGMEGHLKWHRETVWTANNYPSPGTVHR